ncbi:MAG: hypothetical protein MJY55_03980 [Bacteroidales bacterium]|nr:hypothetical protein [Bacteroidales bacterium]
MKNITKIILAATSIILTAACKEAEFVTYNYVSLDARRAKINETCGTYKIGVSVHNAEKCIVTYKVTDGTAKAGEDFDIVDETGALDPSGTLQITDGQGYIYVKVVDRSGVETGNKSFKINLLKASTKDVNLGSTTIINCTIIDADAAINKLIGSWAGEGGSPFEGVDKAKMSMYIDVLDENDLSEKAELFRKTHPNANIAFSNVKFPDTGLESGTDFEVFGYFDENTNKLHIYANQAFNEYNFGELGESYVAITNVDHKDSGDVIFTYNKNTEELKADDYVLVGIFSHDTAMDFKGWADGLNGGAILKKTGE